MFVYYTVLSLNMKLWERFCLKLMRQNFKWISKCLPLVPMDGGSPTPPGNMIIYFIHSLYFFVIRFSSFEVVLNFIHHQYRSRLFLWLPKFKIPLFFAQRNFAEWFINTWDTYFGSQSGLPDFGRLHSCSSWAHDFPAAEYPAAGWTEFTPFA